MTIPYLDLGQLNALRLPQIEQASLRVLRSGHYLNDSEVYAFEQAWAKANGARYCVSTANGLDALTAALQSLKKINRWPDGSEVIVSAHTFIASFEAVTRAGLVAIPCEVNAHDYNIDCDCIAPLVTANTVAIMPVHIYGRPSNMDKIKDIADRHHLSVVTDSCQMHSSLFAPQSSLLSDAVAFSFYPGKNLGALGDAGCLITNNKDLADCARAFCNYGAEIKYRHDIKGINSRMDSLQAAILGVKMQHLDEQNTMRQTQAQRYNEGIQNPLISLPYNGQESEKSAWHIYPVFCEHRNQLQNWLANRGIGTIIHYPTPPHKQQAYRELNSCSLPVTEHICSTELSLPLNPVLTTDQQDYIINALNDFKVE